MPQGTISHQKVPAQLWPPPHRPPPDTAGTPFNLLLFTSPTHLGLKFPGLPPPRARARVVHVPAASGLRQYQL